MSFEMQMHSENIVLGSKPVVDARSGELATLNPRPERTSITQVRSSNNTPDYPGAPNVTENAGFC